MFSHYQQGGSTGHYILPPVSVGLPDPRGSNLNSPLQGLRRRREGGIADRLSGRQADKYRDKHSPSLPTRWSQEWSEKARGNCVALWEGGGG